MAEGDDEYETLDQLGASYAVVHSLPDKPVVACTIFTEKDAPMAHRQWILRPDGIHVVCTCTGDGRPLKVRANPDGTTEVVQDPSPGCSDTIAPEPVPAIHDQLTSEIERFCDDWMTRPIRYLYSEEGKERETRHLLLGPPWLDEDLLDYAAASWYISEGERILDQIEEVAGSLDGVRARFMPEDEPTDVGI